MPNEPSVQRRFNPAAYDLFCRKDGGKSQGKRQKLEGDENGMVRGITPMIKAAFAAPRQQGKLSNNRVVGSRDHQKGIVIVVVGLMLAVSCDFSRRQTAPQV